jgi:hypothetical protein
MHKGSFCAALMVGAILVSQTGMSQQMVPLEDAVKEAAGRSTLAAPGGAPFHLRATISDEKAHDPQYDARSRNGGSRRRYGGVNFTPSLSHRRWW